MAEWAAVIVSLILGVLNLVWNITLSIRQTKISEGQIELEMAKQLSDAKKYVDNYDKLCIDSIDDKGKRRELINAKKGFILEEYLNCMDNLCQEYLDKNVDTTRFQKNYCVEVRNLYKKDSIFRERLEGDSSPFHAIKKVYNLWNNTEL